MQAKLDAMRATGIPEQRIAATTTGTPEEIARHVQAYRDAGLDGFTFSMPDVHDLEALALAGETLAPLFNPERQR